MTDPVVPAGSARRPPAGAGPGRNKSFRKAREAAEAKEAASQAATAAGQYLDMSLDDVQKYFSPETWRKMTGMNLHSVPSSSVQKYFDPVAWEKLQRLGCLRGRPTTATPAASASSSAPASTTAAAPSGAPMAAAKGCFSPRSWEALTRLNVVPAAAPSPRCPRRGEDALRDEDEDEDDDFLEHGMDEGEEDDSCLSSAVHLEGLEGGDVAEGGGGGGHRGVADGLRLYFTLDQWRKLRERGVLERAFRRLSKETSV